MNKPITILLFLLMISFQSLGQTLESKDVYSLKSRQYTWMPDSVIYKDTVDLNPFKDQKDIKQVTVFVRGLEQSYRLDMKLTDSDTTALVTAYTYEIKRSKPTKEEKKMFRKVRILIKEEWRLKTKLTPISDTIINSVLKIVGSVDFNSLPSYEEMQDEIGLLQLDGNSFGFTIRNGNEIMNYGVNSLYLNRHEKLKALRPLEPMLLDYLKSKNDLKVNYLDNACYNNGSVTWICK